MLGTECYAMAKSGRKFLKVTKNETKIAKNLRLTSKPATNPLKGTKYTRKVFAQMEKTLKTGRPDFHGFPRIVDNYACLGKQECIKGSDGIMRLKVNLEGGYQGYDGFFEWIIEENRSVNHRVFIPKH